MLSCTKFFVWGCLWSTLWSDGWKSCITWFGQQSSFAGRLAANRVLQASICSKWLCSISPSVTWRREWGACSCGFHQFEQADHSMQSRIGLQSRRSQHRLEGWANKSFMTFSKSKCTALVLGRDNPQQRHRLRTACLGSSSVEKLLGLWVGIKTSVDQQYLLGSKGTVSSAAWTGT